jgi:hypothetical protein
MHNHTGMLSLFSLPGGSLQAVSAAQQHQDTWVMAVVLSSLLCQ